MKKLAIASMVILMAVYQLKAQERSNIIFILTDDMGYSDINCFGGDFVPTPNIDRIAKAGIKFTKYYSAAPICSPSRVSLLTGMYPARWNFTAFLNNKKVNRAAEQADFLDPIAPSLARIFKNAGYATDHFGKWHMGGGRDVHKMRQVLSITALMNTTVLMKAQIRIRSSQPPIGFGRRTTA